MKIYLRLEAPFEWVRVNGKKVDAFGEVPTLDDYPMSDDDDIVGVVPGKWVTTHTVSLPAKSKKQFSAALPYALEESLSEEVENMHFVSPNWKAGEPCNVMVVSKAKMLEWQSLANDHRLPISKLLPEHALVPSHDAAECSISLNDKQVFAKQQGGLGVSFDSDFLDVWMMDVPMSTTIAVNDEQLTEKLIVDHPDRDFRYWAFGNKMAHWLEYPVQFDTDLWTDQFRPSVRRIGNRAFLLPVAFIIFAIVGMLAYDSYRYISLHREIASIHQENQALLKEALPEIDFVGEGREREVLEKAISRMGGADRSRNMQAMLAFSAGVLRSQNVTLTDLVYRDSELVITCLLSDFSQVDILTKQLNGNRSLQATLQSSAADGGDIIASYSLKQT